jgi:hypothetical protein
MRLLIDTDAFCKLALADLLHETLGSLEVAPVECGRLPALPHMLRRGRIRRLYGPDSCDRLLEVAESFAEIKEQPSASWLDRLARVETIDPGEAQLYALAAERSLLVLSFDKRALHGLKTIEGFPAALKGRIVVPETVLVALCRTLGPEVVRQRITVLKSSDQMIRACFSSGNSEPTEALLSYSNSLARDLEPLKLWSPDSGGRE